MSVMRVAYTTGKQLFVKLVTNVNTHNLNPSLLNNCFCYPTVLLLFEMRKRIHY